MLLLRLGVGKWTVLALCEAAGVCAVLDLVENLGEKRGNQVLSDLREYVPVTDSRDWVRSEFSESLTGADGILEFRWPKHGGGTPRVLWFYDENRVIVCTHGVDKKGKLDPAEIRRAEAWKTAYAAAKARKDLVIVAFDEFDID